MKNRGFEKVKRVGNDNDFVVPKRSAKHSAGYDFVCPIDTLIAPQGRLKIATGIKAYMLPDEMLCIYPRSSLGFKHGIMLANTVGIVDSDYYNNEDNEGEIFIKLFNSSDKVLELKKGERFAQGIFQKFLLTDDDDCDSVRNGGIGSTGK